VQKLFHAKIADLLWHGMAHKNIKINELKFIKKHREFLCLPDVNGPVGGSFFWIECQLDYGSAIGYF